MKLLEKLSCIIFAFVIALGVTSCSKQQQKTQGINLYYADGVEHETYEFEHFYFETYEDAKIFYEHFDNEVYEINKVIPDLVENEYFYHEEVVNEDFSESLYCSLPESFTDFDIDWEEVIKRFAIGTTVIVVAGILTVATLETPVAYIFATAFAEGLKQALIGGTIGGIINAAIKSMQDGTFSSKILKYFIEGFADGFMWGAISGTITGAIKGAITVTNPANYFSKDGTELIGRVDANGNFYDTKNNLLGRLEKTSNNNQYLIGNDGHVVYMFGDNNLMANITKAYPDGLAIIKAPRGRYSGGSFEVDGDKVYKGGKFVGRLNEAGDVIGVNEYQGMLIAKIDSSGKSVVNYMRAINGGISLDAYGTITNQFVEQTTTELLKGGATVQGYFNCRNGAKATVVLMNDKLYLMDSNNKILAMLDDFQNIASNWNQTIASLANTGVKETKTMIIKMIQNNVPYDYGPSFTDDVIAYIQEYGKFPPDLNFQGHHINNVANYPWLADNPNNIQYYTYLDHLNAHGGKWSNSTSGPLRDLVEIFISIFGG